MVFFLDALRLCTQYTHLLMLELPLVLSIVWLPSSPPLDARGPYLRRSDAVAMCLWCNRWAVAVALVVRTATPGYTRALLHHCCAHCGPLSHAIALFGRALSLSLYTSSSRQVRSTEGVSPSMAPLTHSPWSPLSALREPSLTLHGTYLSSTMGPLSHPAWTLSHPLWDALLTLHGTPLSLTPSPSYYTPPSLTHLCTHLCIHHLTHHCAFPPQDPPLLPAHHRVRHLTHHSPNP